MLLELKDGKVDFYPGFNFTMERAVHFYYLENGLPGGDIGISPPNLPDITHLNQLKGKTLVNAAGGPNYLEGIEGVKEARIIEMPLEKAIKLIRHRRYDFHIYNKSSIEYYLKKNNVTDVKIHPNCCGGIKPLYLGFSRNSSHFKEETNPDYNPAQKITIQNFPTRLSKGSLAWKLAQALKKMKEKGETAALYNRYYKN